MDVEDLGQRIEALAQQAVALVNADQNVQALDTFHQALDLLETVPSRSARKQVEGALRWRLASALLPLGRDDEAESELRLALDVLSHVWDADHERIRVLIALAGLLTQQTRLDEAEEILRECHETILVPEDDILYMTHLDGIALWLNATGRHAEAVTFLRRTTAHYRRIEGAEMDLCFALEVLALAESAIGDIDDAVSHAREAVQVRERAGHSSSSVSSARANLANVLMAAGRAQESGEEVEKAEALQADIPEQGTDRARLLLVRSNGEVMAGHFVQALRSIEEALEAARGAIRREPMLEAQCLIGLGSGRLFQDDPQGAVAAFTEAKNIYMDFNAPSTGAVVCLTGIAKARAMAGLFPLAMAALDEARGLMDSDARRRERVSVDSTQAQILLTWALDVGDPEQAASLCRLALAVAVPAIILADEQRFQFKSESERSAWIGDLERGALIDTAFRAARLQIAEFLGDYMDTDQRKIGKRLLITIPLFVVGVILTRVDFTVLWRYFSWANQTTATIMLWTAAAYLYRHQKFHWVCTIPAVFMTQVCASYLFFDQKIGFGWVWAKVGFGEHLWDAAMVSGAVVAAALTALFFIGLKPSGMNAGGIVAVSMDD